MEIFAPRRIKYNNNYSLNIIKKNLRDNDRAERRKTCCTTRIIITAHCTYYIIIVYLPTYLPTRNTYNMRSYTL